jgi:hypothetical protein
VRKSKHKFWYQEFIIVKSKLLISDRTDQIKSPPLNSFLFALPVCRSFCHHSPINYRQRGSHLVFPLHLRQRWNRLRLNLIAGTWDRLLRVVRFNSNFDMTVIIEISGHYRCLWLSSIWAGQLITWKNSLNWTKMSKELP